MHQTIKINGLTWHHFNKPTKEDLAFMEKNFDFHPLDYEDIRTDTSISKLDVYQKYVFCVFHIPVMNKKTRRLQGDDLFVFLSKNQLVTNTNSPIPVIEDLVRQINKDKKLKERIGRRGAAYLLYQILAAAFEDAYPLVRDLSERVTSLEDKIQSRNVKTATVELARTRRNLLYLRHILDPQRHMLITLSDLKQPFVPKDMHLYFDDVRDTLDTMWLTADNLKAIVDGLFEVNEALLSHKTNDIITILTVLSASLMVPTLISGFYGMNVPWLPFKEDASVIGLFFIVSFVVVVLAIISIIRRKKI